MLIYIYKITHIETGRMYIGQTDNIKERWKQHCYKDSGCVHLRNAIQKYGRRAFKFEVLLTCPPGLANEIETGYIQWYDSVNSGFNICPIGGSSRGRKHTPEAKGKMSKSRKGKYTGEANGMAKLTDIQRQEIKQLYSTGEHTLVDLGKMYSVSYDCISRLVRKETTVELREKQKEVRKGKYSGEKHGRSKLTDIQRQEIRELGKTHTVIEIAKMYSVSWTCINRILK